MHISWQDIEDWADGFPVAGISSQTFLAMTISIDLGLFYKTLTICNLDHYNSWPFVAIQN